ncbi:MAG TPA: endonuclease/exonuclease/phosphatase family protein [Myxococcaceae bacterium]|nr:endonuclease/exonuclease/phosphatase family protein [Myxococcaceae bacterium]
MHARQLLPLALLLALTGCGPSRTILPRDGGTDAGRGGADAGTSADGGRDGGADAGWGQPDAGGDDFDGGTPAVLRVTSWNVEWFGDSANGPRDEPLQQRNVQDILRVAGHDVYGLVEVVNPTSFNALIAALPDYRGILASDTTQVGQPATCSSSGGSPCYWSNEQKPALLYKASTVTVRDAQLILTHPSYDYVLAGRAPLRVDLTVNVRGFSTDLVVIVVHLKASADAESQERRWRAANDLKQYLDTNLANQKVLVIGDWNDDLDQSITWSNGAYLPTPFQQFLDDPADYTFITQPLTLSGAQSTVRYPNVIDHHLATRGMKELYLAGSVQVMRPDQWGQQDYASTAYLSTTDHYPVESAYLLGVVPASPDGGVDGGVDAGFD